MTRVSVALLAAVIAAGFGGGLGGLVGAQQARSCTQFASQAEAQAAYAADPTDPAGNDEDGDGIACENVIYGNTTTDFGPVRGIGAAGITMATEPTAMGIGGSGMTFAAPEPKVITINGIGASGLTPARGIGASGTTWDDRDAVAGSMTAMPDTGAGTVGPGSWVSPAVWLLAALVAGGMSIRGLGTAAGAASRSRPISLQIKQREKRRGRRT